MNEICVGVNPTYFNNYAVTIIGSVSDLNGLITKAMENQLVKVWSRCIIDLDLKNVFFEIISIESFSNLKLTNSINNVANVNFIFF